METREQFNFENPLDELGYPKLLEAIAVKKEFLSDIAQEFLKRPDLLQLIRSKKADMAGFGVNRVEPNPEEIILKGITLNPKFISDELTLHELLHFFYYACFARCGECKK